jgi:hypothetical protein
VSPVYQTAKPTNYYWLESPQDYYKLNRWNGEIYYAKPFAPYFHIVSFIAAPGPAEFWERQR